MMSAPQSSLVSAILGEMGLGAGGSRVGGSLAVVTQQSWIFSGTVRENITLGAEWRPAWFNTCVQAAALSRDLATLTQGDLTEVQYALLFGSVQSSASF